MRPLAAIIRRLRRMMGLPVPLATEDRRVLEEVILPFYAARADIREVLSVGVRDYTGHYPGLLPGKSFYTLDNDPLVRRWGGCRHVVDGVENLALHFAPASLDLILLNGVFGWGLDRLEGCEKAIAACHGCLRPGGELVVGWNDVPQHRPFPLESIQALGRFVPECFPPLGVQRYVTATANRHTYDFYRVPTP